MFEYKENVGKSKNLDETGNCCKISPSESSRLSPGNALKCIWSALRKIVANLHSHIP